MPRQRIFLLTDPTLGRIDGYMDCLTLVQNLSPNWHVKGKVMTVDPIAIRWINYATEDKGLGRMNLYFLVPPKSWKRRVSIHTSTTDYFNDSRNNTALPWSLKWHWRRWDWRFWDATLLYTNHGHPTISCIYESMLFATCHPFGRSPVTDRKRGGWYNGTIFTAS